MDLLNACKKRDCISSLDIIRSGNFDDQLTDKNGNTALMLACINRMPEVASELIKSNRCDRRVKNRFGLTALMVACKNRMPDTAIQLLQAGKTNPGVVNCRGETALIIACHKKLSTVALECIKFHPSKCKPGHVDQQGNTALILACKFGFDDVAKALLSTKKPNPKQYNKQGEKPLMLALENDFEDISKTLVSTINCNPKQRNKLEQTALILAFENPNISESVVLDLLDVPGSFDRKHITEMFEGTIDWGEWSDQCHKFNAVRNKLLTDFSHHIDVNYVRCFCKPGKSWCYCRKDSLLMTACYKKQPDIALKILELGRGKIDLDHKNRCGNTALIFACRYMLTDVALALIDAGASPDIVGNIHSANSPCCGYVTALMITCILNMPVVALKLLSTGRSNYQFADYQRSAIDYAIDNDMRDVVLYMQNLIAKDGPTRMQGSKYINYQ